MITISVCMIVKNEEAVLARCLDSLVTLADEIIIIDTGSTDRTKEIASVYTDKIYDFKWIDDFAAARNFSFDKASCDYIYQADADEVINTENIHRFMLLKQNLLPEIDIVQMYYTNQLDKNTTYNFDKELRPKLYKRIRTFRYEGAVHEQVILSPVIYDSDIEIIHMPADNHAERDLETFRRSVSRQGDLSDRLMEMYARELFIAGTKDDFIKAEDFFCRKAESAVDKDKLRMALCVMSKAARLREDERAFFGACIKVLALGEAPSEVCYELGEFYFQIHDYREASIWYYNACHETSPVLAIKYGSEYPELRLEKCRELEELE